jgi:hypothetical protein
MNAITIPNELWVYNAQFMQNKSILNLSATCKALRFEFFQEIIFKKINNSYRSLTYKKIIDIKKIANQETLNRVTHLNLTCS